MSAGALEPAPAEARGEAGGPLEGQTLVVLGGSAGIGFETARRARAEGAEVIITARNPDPLERAARALAARDAKAFDAADPAALKDFFAGLDAPVDHVMLTAGRPEYGHVSELGADRVRNALASHQLLALEVAELAPSAVRSGGSLVLIGGTGGRRPRAGGAIVNAATAAMPPLTASLALELAPTRVNLIAPGFVDTPLSASLLGEDLEQRRRHLRETLPIGRVVGPRDVAALAVHLMVNTAITGATFDIDGGQQLVE